MSFCSVLFCVCIDGDVSAPLLDLPTLIYLPVIFAITLSDLPILIRLLHRQGESLLAQHHGTRQVSIHHPQYTPLPYRETSLISRNCIHQIQISIRIRIRIPIQQQSLGVRLAAGLRGLKRERPQRVSRYTRQVRVSRKGAQVESRRSRKRMKLQHDPLC